MNTQFTAVEKIENLVSQGKFDFAYGLAVYHIPRLIKAGKISEPYDVFLAMLDTEYRDNVEALIKHHLEKNGLDDAYQALHYPEESPAFRLEMMEQNCELSGDWSAFD
jgi:hypothetical protein